MSLNLRRIRRARADGPSSGPTVAQLLKRESHCDDRVGERFIRCVSTAACRIEEHGRRRVVAPPRDRSFERAAAMLDAAGDVGRMRVLVALAEGPSFVSDLAQKLGVRLAHASQQLAVLREARLVRAKRRGKSVEYALADDHVRVLVAKALACAAARTR